MKAMKQIKQCSFFELRMGKNLHLQEPQKLFPQNAQMLEQQNFLP